ncbi:hypothetical protein RvY_05774 [Ramazzottius varieornatus]|uniref:Hexosyltransferase n=1 Tax=Ramazzottius varieornatus TaxID=947166 RepID=A0A1D1UWP4_RAMVA|nr:hypothetical protein RvY_05774 [Ramazzottius varieornatus]
MILFVSSRPKDAEMRLSIRSTWGATAKTCRIVVVFGFGAVDSDTLQDEIAKEGRVFGDILQFQDIRDSYRNQTRIVLTFYEWARLNCNQTEYVAKADDDTWINLPLVLSSLESIKARSFIAGYWFPPGTSVMRTPEHAQWLSREERLDDYYPAYCSGILYVIPTRMVSAVLNTAATMQIHWIDDAFITGDPPEVPDAGDVITKINKDSARAKKEKKREAIVRYGLTGWLTLPYNQSATSLCRLLLKSTIMHRINSYTKQALYNLSCLQEQHSCRN